MQTNHVDHAGVTRLRCIFDGKVVSLSFAADMAFGEVARTLGEHSDPRYGNPVAIDVTLALPPAVRNGWQIADYSWRRPCAQDARQLPPVKKEAAHV